jgi:hypothetical protein
MQAFRRAWDETWSLARSAGGSLLAEDAMALALGALGLDLAQEARHALDLVLASTAGGDEETLARQVQAELERSQKREREALRHAAGVRAGRPGDVLACDLAHALSSWADGPGCTGSLAA